MPNELDILISRCGIDGVLIDLGIYANNQCVLAKRDNDMETFTHWKYIGEELTELSLKIGKHTDKSIPT